MMHPITKSGYKNLQEALKKLITVDREKALLDVKNARDHGDLKENHEYQVAMEHYDYIINKIIATQKLLSESYLVNIVPDNTKVCFGATVQLSKCTEIYSFQILGPAEADIEKNQISTLSPLAKAIIGKTVNEEVNVHVGANTIVYKILSISYDTNDTN